MNDLTMCLKWGQVGPSPLSGAVSASMFFRLNSKQPSASEMTTLRRQPQSYTLMDTAVYLCCWLQWGNRDWPPPTVILLGPYQCRPNAGSLIEAQWWRLAESICTLARAKPDAFQNISGKDGKCVCLCVCRGGAGYLQFDQNVWETLLCFPSM